MEQDNMTERHTGQDGKPKWAVFLPAISSFYATYISKQRNQEYVSAERMPDNIPEMEMLNFLNSKEGLFHYRWGLYSAGHADMDLSKFSGKDDMVRTREPNTVILGDSGGFQIAKGVWEGDWKNPSCPKAKKRRETVLEWLDHTADYAMTLDVPTWIVYDPHAVSKTGITTYDEAVAATQYNNEYFIANRKGVKNGGAKFLNVLQGSTHAEADHWYELMKEYCDPKVYPENHFNGWGMGGQNMCSVTLILKRIVTLMEDGLLQEGVHDWMHFLGTSKLEWAIVLTVIQNAIRKYHNPSLTISFDCASPFLATANGQVYTSNEYPDRGKWTYSMKPSADDKKYAKDQRSYRDAVLQDGIFDKFEDSPVSERLLVSDVCCYGPGDLNKLGKEGKTSWDSFSYALLMVHNVHRHINAVQTANDLYEKKSRIPRMLVDERTTRIHFDDVIDQIFATAKQKGKEEALKLIAHHDRFLTNIIGTRGRTGKKETTSHTHFNALFDFDDPGSDAQQNDDFAEEKLDELENSQE